MRLSQFDLGGHPAFNKTVKNRDGNSQGKKHMMNSVIIVLSKMHLTSRWCPQQICYVLYYKKCKSVYMLQTCFGACYL